VQTQLVDGLLVDLVQDARFCVCNCLIMTMYYCNYHFMIAQWTRSCRGFFVLYVLFHWTEILGAVYMVPLTRDSMKCDVF
jgi:hypothetical protein